MDVYFWLRSKSFKFSNMDSSLLRNWREMLANVAQQEKHKLGLKQDDPVLTKDRRGTTRVSDLLCRFGRSFLTRKDKVCDGSSDRIS